MQKYNYYYKISAQEEIGSGVTATPVPPNTENKPHDD